MAMASASPHRLAPTLWQGIFLVLVYSARFAGGFMLLPSMRVVGIESTPNPLSFKFSLDNPVEGSSGATYDKRNILQAPKPIREILGLPGVASVYALSDWVCVNKIPTARWDDIVAAAVDALGGATAGLDALSLLAPAGGGSAGSSEGVRSEMDGISIRLQISNGVPIQVEACAPGGSPVRRKLSSRFTDAMAYLISRSGDEMSFFKGRKWVPRGLLYPTEEEIAAVAVPGARAGSQGAMEAALVAAIEEVELAFPEARLREAVMAKPAETLLGRGQLGEGLGAGAVAAGELSAVLTALHSSERGRVVAAVDTLCGLADGAAAKAAPEKALGALSALVAFVASGEGPVAARRSAVAFLGGATLPEGGDSVEGGGEWGGAWETLRMDAIMSVFRGDPNPSIRRTAGDALSDVGDPRGVSAALEGLRDPSKLVRWRAARVVGELGGGEGDGVVGAVDVLQALESARVGEEEFEVAFEMSDAARRVKSRVGGGGGRGGGSGGGACLEADSGEERLNVIFFFLSYLWALESLEGVRRVFLNPPVHKPFLVIGRPEC
ncbi:unnamed protein product [Discosporangium mesarthrocarpum]